MPALSLKGFWGNETTKLCNSQSSVYLREQLSEVSVRTNHGVFYRLVAKAINSIHNNNNYNKKKTYVLRLKLGFQENKHVGFIHGKS